jgi:tetratricopeptide (TPR) repeat protein
VKSNLELLRDGLDHQRAGQNALAEAAYRAVLDAEPDEPHALHYLGLLTLQMRRFPEALALLHGAMTHRPQQDAVRTLYGRGLLAAGRGDDAVAHFQDVVKSRPCDASSHANLALAFLQTGAVASAIAAADIAIDFDRGNGDAWFARGTALAQSRRGTEAIFALKQAVACNPGHAEAHLNLGNALLDCDVLEDAETHLRRAIALDPSLAEAHASLGFLLTGDGRHDEAIDTCATAIALRPDFAQAHWNQSFAHMLKGDYAAGWEKYEWRKRHDRFIRDLTTLPGREWQGEPLLGQTVLVRAEQGLGDTIQFARYLPMLIERGADVMFAGPQALNRLFRQIAGLRVISRTTSLPTYDFWIDQMSLPRLLGTRADSVPRSEGYLSADADATARWRARLAPGFRVGLVWAGNPAHSNDARRSMPLLQLAPFIPTPGCAFVSLQVGPSSGEIVEMFGIEDRSSALTDLAKTASLVSALDLVVTVDSCVAHLAGALGVPAWIMLPFAPDWRWLAGRCDSPWYDSVRLFRQTRPGDWAGVVARVAEALLARVSGTGTALRVTGETKV